MARKIVLVVLFVMLCFYVPTFSGAQVTLLSPNGGETLLTGEQYSISWLAPEEAVIFRILYSINNGMTWKLITDTGSGSSHPWIVPPQSGNKTKCLVKVVGYNTLGVKVGADKSDTPFTIEVVKLDTPNGGEFISWGNQETISWTTNKTRDEVTKVKLHYTTDGGVTWNKITTLEGNPKSYDWDVPCTWNKTKSNCKVKTVLADSSGKVLGQDTSDNYFTLVPGCVDISGSWYGSENGSITCWYNGYSETAHIDGSGTVQIVQDACRISSWTIPDSIETRHGTLCGNDFKIAGEFCIDLVGGAAFTANQFHGKGVVSEDEINIKGSGYCAGSYEGVNFSCTGNTHSSFTRYENGMLATGNKDGIRQAAPLFFNDFLGIISIVSQ